MTLQKWLQSAGVKDPMDYSIKELNQIKWKLKKYNACDCWCGTKRFWANKLADEHGFVYDDPDFASSQTIAGERADNALQFNG